MEKENIIWADFRKGEKYALSHIYSENVDFLYRYGKKFTQNSDLVKDTIQDLFIDLIKTHETLGPTDNVRYYLMLSLRRKLTRNLKKENSKKKIKETEPNITYSAEEEIINRENLTNRDKIIQHYLQELCPRQREILFYRYICEFNYSEICELMSIKYDSARKLVYRALESLKKLLNETEMKQFLLNSF